MNGGPGMIGVTVIPLNLSLAKGAELNGSQI